MQPTIVSGPSGGAALRWWARMARDPLATYVGLQRVYGDAVRLPLRRNRPLLLLSRPEHAEHVLVSRQHNYVKAITYQPLRALLGSGLLISEAEVWQRHRRIVGPVFVRRHHRVRTRNRRRVEIGFVQPSLRRAPDAEACP